MGELEDTLLTCQNRQEGNGVGDTGSHALCFVWGRFEHLVGLLQTFTDIVSWLLGAHSIRPAM
jgi:hypothetical protein